MPDIFDIFLRHRCSKVKLHFVFDTLQLTFELLVSCLFDLLSVTSYLSDIIFNLNLLANMSSINESENSFN
jgi:hypothetical protein